MIPLDGNVADGFKAACHELLPHGFLNRLGSRLDLMNGYIHIRQQVAGADEADELMPKGIVTGEFGFHIPDGDFAGRAHEVHLIQAHTQREEVTRQISLLDFLSIMDCHFDHGRFPHLK